MIRDFDALHGFFAERRLMPFEWGKRANDCISFGAGAIAAMTGRDVLKDLPNWSSEVGALRLVAKLGGMGAAASSVLTEIPIAHAHRGDIAGITDPIFPGGLRLMVVDGEMLIGPGAAGTGRASRREMVRAWSAG